MQEIRLRQVAQQKLSPQQLQFVQLLQIPAADMQARVAKELEENPALEEAEPADDPQASLDTSEDLLYDPAPTRSWHKNRAEAWEDWPSKKIFKLPVSLYEHLHEQLALLELTARQHAIAEYLIGSLDASGYLQRALIDIVDDIALTGGPEVHKDEIQAVLHQVQTLDPPGVAARDLQECLTLQLQRKDAQDPAVRLAQRIITTGFADFMKKHYDKLAHQLDLDDPAALKPGLKVIQKLQPKPAAMYRNTTYNPVLQADFLITQQHGQCHVLLRDEQLPQIRIKRSYTAWVKKITQKATQGTQQVTAFIKAKLARAQRFMTALKQRQETLRRIMEAIVKLQQAFFLHGDLSQLRPLRLRDVAEAVGVDVSTASRVVGYRSVQTTWGVYPLKFFFSEGIGTAAGVAVSSQAVKNDLEALVKAEDKASPYTDDQLVQHLRQAGYQLARRTVAKYRDQLRIPVARLRKSL